MRAFMQRCKIVQDDMLFQSLQEIHDFLLQESGFDPDTAFSLWINKVQALLDDGVSERPLSSLTQEQRERVNEEIYGEMKTHYSKPNLLNSFFQRIFYSLDELFIFKKYFTTFHGTNSFFSYVFNQADVFTLQHLSVSK